MKAIKNMTENEISKIVVDSAIKIHRALATALLKDGISRVVSGLKKNLVPLRLCVSIQ